MKRIILLALLIVLLAACSADNGQPVERQQLLATAPAATTDPALIPTAPPAATSATPGNLRPIPVDGVQIEVGVGSPIPVDIFVSGSWPDLCAQIAQINQRMSNNQIEVELLATAADPNCPPDFIGLPFRIAIPVNTVEMGEGTYPVVVNGVTAAAPLTIPLPQPAPQPGEETPGGEADVAAFEAQLQQAVLERNYGQMQALMGDPFTIAGWRSEGASYAPAAAVEQLQLNYIGQGTALGFQPMPEAMVNEFQGMFGPDVNVAKMLYATGWGLQGTDEALLYIARRPDGSLYWHGVLSAFGGFGDAAQPAPASGAQPTDVQFVMAQADVPILNDGLFANVGQVFAGQTAAVLGISADGLYWQVPCPDGSEGACWVSTDPQLTQPSAPPGG